MEQLSGADYLSLVAERRNVYNHVGTLCIYDVSSAPGGKVRFKDILRHYQERLYLHPILRRRLVVPPLGVDRPYLLAEGEIDVEFHIRHIALPKPGDWRQLMIQVARLHSRPLDRTRPLWEAYVIEGLDNIPNLPPGAFAVFFKIHHAVVDGMAAIHLVEQLHNEAPQDPTTAVVVERDPLLVELLAGAAGHALSRVGRAARLSARLLGSVGELGGRQLRELVRNRRLPALKTLGGLAKAPTTPFSGKVTGNRVIEGFGMPFSRIARVRAKLPGITLNDIFIAVAGGGVRNYLLMRGALPEQSLVGLMPISLRTDASAGGNQVAGVPVPVCSDIADPLARLHAVHAATAASKGKAEALGLDTLKNLFDVLPPVAVNFFVERMMVPGLNMAVSNVRGPDGPMYLAGAKAMCLYPVSIPADGAGLNITAVSYNRVLWVSAVSCRQMLPDPQVFIDCLRDAWTELLAAADALAPVPAAVKTKGKSKAGAPAEAVARKSPSRQRRVSA